MKSSQKRNISFIYGLILGIAFGIALSILIFDVTFQEEKSITNLGQQIQAKNKTETEKPKITKSSKDKKEKQKTHKQLQNSKTIHGTDPIDGIDEEYSDSINSKENIDLYDTTDNQYLLTDSVNYNYDLTADTFLVDTMAIEIPDKETDFNNESDNDIVVMRDELMTVRSTIIEGIMKHTDRADSLMMPAEPEKEKNVMRVELWRSPVNFYGYKLAKNKIILFGVNHYDSLFFMSSNDSTFMKYRNDLYFLESNENFRQLIPLKQITPSKSK